MVTRRHYLFGTLASVVVIAATPWRANAASGAMVVYKDPACGCCGAWADAMRAAGFSVDIQELADLEPLKRKLSVPAQMEACHTAVIDGYFLEGHVPVEAVGKLLSERPEIAGLAVPGMPRGSLGMGTDPAAHYDVYAVFKNQAQPPAVFLTMPV